MQKSLNKKHPYYNDLKLTLKAIIGISLGIFLFLLFFQPLNPQNPDDNNRLLILATFGGITLILLGLMRIIIPSIFSRIFSHEKWSINKEILWAFLFVVFNSVASVFFARFVGKIPATFHMVTIIVILTLIETITLSVVNEYHFLKKQLRDLKYGTIDNKDEILPVENVKIEFESENKSEYFNLFLDEIILIKAANNYIEVIYLNEEKVSKKLIRNTLKNTEVLFSKYPSIIRCHRSCMVNKIHIEKVTKGNEGLILTLIDYPEKIHVSRQYVLKVKEALKTN
jgi:DNA-binding LytR/AlgR family response regulator